MDILTSFVGLSIRPKHSSENLLSWKNFFLSFGRRCHRFLMKHYRDPIFVSSTLAFLLIAYISLPSLLPQSAKSRKHSIRPDKYTTGFSNSANDCFANSTVQSLSGLQRLNDYLTKVSIYELPEWAPKYPIPMHRCMVNVLNTLQETVYSSRSISVWDHVLKMLEKVRGGKISRSQHDAHELLLILLATLEEEYTRYFSFVHKMENEREKKLVKAEIPAFPFNLSTKTFFRCMKCGNHSKATVNPLVVLELNLSHSSTSLESLISAFIFDTIDDYSCFICTVEKLLILEHNTLKLGKLQQDFWVRLKNKMVEGESFINDELFDDPTFLSILEDNHIQKCKSQVRKISNFDTPPDILPIHISRSMYQDMQTWRNSASVTIPNMLEFDTAVYIIKSVIRHQGVHYSGHYECYKRKPQFYKDKETGSYADDLIRIGTLQKRSFRSWKKLISVVNKPFWRISDTKVTEVSLDSVLNDSKGIYIVIYERL